MAFLNTVNGPFKYKNKILYLNNHKIKKSILTENLTIIAPLLDRIGLNWGPIFDSLIGIVKNNDYLSWANYFSLYILKEDEERFKSYLFDLSQKGFSLRRYERSGLYFLERKGEYLKIFVLQKIGDSLRLTGSSDFIFEENLHEKTEWIFEGISFNIFTKVNQYLEFQYGNWIEPQEKRNYKIHKLSFGLQKLVLDNIPDFIYFAWLQNKRKKNFKEFREFCKNRFLKVSSDVDFTTLKPRKYRRILTVGVYDLLHNGHVELFRRAKALGENLIVAVQDSEYILKYKPDSKVLYTTSERLLLVNSIKYVDETIIYKDVEEIVKQVEFDVLVTGPDQIHQGFKNAIDWCHKNGKQHIIIGRTEGVSSSELKSQISLKFKR